MKFYEEDENGIMYVGEENEDGKWIPAPSGYIYEDEANFPKPECGDCLSLMTMPLDKDGLHATGAAYYGLISHDTQTNEPIYGFIDAYEEPQENHSITCEEWLHIPAGRKIDDGYGNYISAPKEEGFYTLYQIVDYRNSHVGFEWVKEE